MEADLGPEVVLAQMVAVVAGEDDDGLVVESGFGQRIENLSDHAVHVDDRGVVSADGFLLATNVHLHVLARLVVDALFGDVVPVAVDFLGQDHFVVGEKVFVVLARGHEGDVGGEQIPPPGRRARLCGLG